MPAINLDDLKHIAAAVRSAPRFADQSVVGLYHRQMLDFASNDGQRGPRKTLPLVLGMIGVIEQTAHEARHTVRRDLLRVAAQTAEFAGWLYRDIGRSEFASYWRDRATEWAQEAGDGVMQGYVLLKKSQAAWDERDAPRMLTLSQAVQAGPWQLPARIRAEAAQQEARAYAMLGADLAFVERRLEEGRELLAADTDLRDMDENLNRHYSPAVFAMQSALCYCEAGRPDKAVDIYSAQLSERIFSRRDYGYFLSLKGIALAALGEPDEASRTGLSAMAIANATSSERTMRELVHLVQRLAPWSQWSSVRQLREAVTAL